MTSPPDLPTAVSAAFDSVPATIQNLARTAADGWQLEAPLVLLAALHQMAAAVGNMHCLVECPVWATCPFNVLICAKQNDRNRFVEHLGQPWIGAAKSLVDEAWGYEPRELLRFVSDVKKAVALPQQGALPTGETPWQRYVRVAPLLKPQLIVHSPLPARIMQALNCSYDRCVLSLDSGLDPLVELSRGGSQQLLRLCSLLASGWEGLDLPGKGTASAPATIHVFWRTHASVARHIVLGRQSPWHTTVPPVLLAWQQSPGGFLGDLPASEFQAWSRLLSALYEKRHEPTARTVWRLSPEAKALWRQFSVGFFQNAECFAPFPQRLFEWFPELVLRLALLLAVLNRLASKDPPAQAFIGSGAMVGASTLAHWLAREHWECLHQLVHFETRQASSASDG